MTGNVVFPIEDLDGKLGCSAQAEYLCDYLRSSEINYKIFIVEENYIDKDFLISNFYSRSFNFKEKNFRKIFPDIFPNFLQGLSKKNNFKNSWRKSLKTLQNERSDQGSVLKSLLKCSNLQNTHKLSPI